MAKPPPRSGAERRRQAAAAARRKEARRRAVVVGAAVVAVVALAVVVIISRDGSGSEPEIPGLRRFGNLSRGHVGTSVDYPETPPVGGEHDPIWQTCGFYSQPVRNENAVHSMEHGAVWITYRPGLPPEQLVRLRELAQRQSYVLVTPFPGLPAPVVASAWGRQLRLPSADDARLAQFLAAFRSGPQAPEQGGSCTGGVGSPEPA